MEPEALGRSSVTGKANAGNRVISVEKLGKRYLVGHEITRERYQSLRDILSRQARDLARKTRDMIRGRQIVQVRPRWVTLQHCAYASPSPVAGVQLTTWLKGQLFELLLLQLAEPACPRTRCRSVAKSP